MPGTPRTVNQVQRAFFLPALLPLQANGPFHSFGSRVRLASAESHDGICTPFVTYPIGTWRSGHPEKWMKDAPAHLSMQPTHAVNGQAALKGQISHIKVLYGVFPVQAAKGHQIPDRDAKPFPCVSSEVLSIRTGRTDQNPQPPAYGL